MNWFYETSQLMVQLGAKRVERSKKSEAAASADSGKGKKKPKKE